jgi:hypothetical protein
MERYNLFIQSTTDLFVDCPEVERTASEPQLTPDELWVRRERQTFRRLERSGAVLFTVRTYMQRLVDVEGEQACALRSQVAGWEDDIRAYKGEAVWGGAFRRWCAEMVGKELLNVELEVEKRGMS